MKRCTIGGAVTPAGSTSAIADEARSLLIGGHATALKLPSPPSDSPEGAPGTGKGTMPDTYRLVTRSDFDGLVCAALLKELGMLDDIQFVHPKDMQDGKIEIGPRDITTNLPYVGSAYLSFDHHSSEAARVQNGKSNHIIDPDADSAARVVYEYFGGRGRFHTI